MNKLSNGRNEMKKVTIDNREYITSKDLHETLKPTISVSNTNKAIRSMETYDALIKRGHIVEISSKTGKSNLDSLLIQNSYNPVMLIDRVAQKAIEHHFKETANHAVSSARENAILGTFGIRLDLLSQDPVMMMLLKQQSDVLALRDQQTVQGERVALLERRVDDMNGDTGYLTVLAFGRRKNVPMPQRLAQRLGGICSRICKERSIQIGRVPDERFSEVNSYPVHVLEEGLARVLTSLPKGTGFEDLDYMKDLAEQIEFVTDEAIKASMRVPQ